MRQYLQRSGIEIEARFEDAAGSPTLPESVHWRLVRVEANRIVRDWSAATPETITGDGGETIAVRALIDIDGELNAIADTTRPRETMEVQVIAGMGTARELSATHRYLVAPLAGGR